MDLNPGGLISWIFVGLFAGWLAGVLVRGSGFGCLGNIVLGVIGAFIGGLLFAAMGISGTAGFLGSVAVATLGAVILLAIANLGRR